MRLSSRGRVVGDIFFARRGRAIAYMTVIEPGGINEAGLLATMIHRL